MSLARAKQRVFGTGVTCNEKISVQDEWISDVGRIAGKEKRTVTFVTVLFLHDFFRFFFKNSMVPAGELGLFFFSARKHRT